MPLAFGPNPHAIFNRATLRRIARSVAAVIAYMSGVLAACQDPIRPITPARVRPHEAVRRSVQFTPRCVSQFPAKPASSPYGIGVNLLALRPNASPPDPTADTTYGAVNTLLGQANIGWLRVDFDWGRSIGTSRDTSQLEWRAVDAAVNRAVCSGANVLGVLAYTPGWAVNRAVPVPTKKYTYLPDNMSDWAAFVRAAVTRYPQIRYWSIWNEPNGDQVGNRLGDFRGYGTETSPDQLVPAYEALIQAAAPHIRGNPDGQGRRFVVAPELAGGGAATDTWRRRVLTDQGANIDVVAVHRYGEATTIRDYVAGPSGRLGLPSWPWAVWLTEAGPTGCNEGAANVRSSLAYCVSRNGSERIYIEDQYQASHLTSVLEAMQGRWAKTFYWHSHTENVALDVGNDYGILRGARANALVGRPAFAAYAQLAGPLGITGPQFAEGGYAQVTVTPAVPSASRPYHYVWSYRWCFQGDGGIYDCTVTWYPYDEGSDMRAVDVYVSPEDYWVEVRAQQYNAAGGIRIGGAVHRVFGPADCRPPRARS